MNRVSTENPNWLMALTLNERVAARRTRRGDETKTAFDLELAERRMQRWRSQAPFSNGSHFGRRLEAEQLTEAEFLQLLGEPIESLSERCDVPPAWLTELGRVLSLYDAQPSGAPASPGADGGSEAPGFLAAVEPFIRRGMERIREGVFTLRRTHSGLPFRPERAEELVLPNLFNPLMAMMSRTMVLELNVARLEGVLEGSNPEERFRSFINRLRQPEVAVNMLEEYPVLARLLNLCVEQWVDFSLEFFRHLAADWDALRNVFMPEEDPGLLVAAASGAGDTHREGRSVILLSFESGLRLAYKPRSLSIDLHFTELLNWLNERGSHAPLRAPKVLDRGNYGWSEFVSPRSCTGEEEVRRFYERQGGYLALLYTLEATDFHFENLIAAGEHPVLIDLEALFHPRLDNPSAPRRTQGFAFDVIAHSVLRTGLLPQRLWMSDESDGIDLSGLGGAPGQLTPREVTRWENVGTDEMRAGLKKVEMKGSDNRPAINGAEVKVEDYVEEILRGFTAVYSSLLEHREELLSDAGPLARFARDEVRVILRPTMAYGLLLQNSFHPDLLRNALDRDRLFDRLWSGIEHAPSMSTVISAEQSDLRRGDIPVFTCSPDSRDILTSGNVRITDFFEATCLDAVRRRLLALSETDLKLQSWFIRASLTTLTTGEGQGQWVGSRLKKSQARAGREQLLEASRAVGDRLEELAVREGDCVSWIGLTLIKGRAWTLLPASTDLYSGLPGIALFLAYLGKVTGEERYTRLAGSAAVSMTRMHQERAEQAGMGKLGIGAFSGEGGMIYALTHLGVLWDSPELLARAASIVETLPDLIEQDEELDIVGGAAGCIRVLNNLYRCTSSRQALAASVRCGDRLIARARAMSRGLGWAQGADGERPLTGYSHGAAGMADALLELWALTGKQRFRSAALDAINYERSQFIPAAGNWADHRDAGEAQGDAQPKTAVTWCHGAPGIGLARLRSLTALDDAELRAEIEAALETTRERGFGLNHSLCHGDLGNIELLLQASLAFRESRRQECVERTAAMILRSIQDHGWICGTPSGVETPGLMNGLAGIGYGLLRLAEPARVPSVLSLAAPHLQERKVALVS